MNWTLAEKMNWVSLLFVLCFLWISLLGFADGGIFLKLDSPDLKVIKENQQIAIISHDGTYEHLVLAVQMNTQEKMEGEAVWIFPVPAPPEDIKMDIVKNFSLPGSAIELHDLLEKHLFYFSVVSAGTQIYPLAYLPLLFIESRDGKSQGGIEQVSVHAVVEKMGLSSELVTARDEVKFGEYIRAKGLNFPQKASEIIKTYIGKQYSFVVTWISDVSLFLNVQKVESTPDREYTYIQNPVSVYVTFKTPRIYFPLKLTSIYEEVIPIRLYMMGVVAPEQKNLPFNIDADYYYVDDFTPSKDFVPFYGGKENVRDLVYSKISIKEVASKFADDLWFRKGAPFHITAKYWVIKWFIAVGIIYYLFLSCLSSLLAGMIAFSRSIMPPKKVLFFIGLLNCFTLVGFILFTYRIISKYTPKVNEEIQKIAEEAGVGVSYYSIERKFYIWFVLIFLFFTLISTHIFRLMFTNYIFYK